ncbi:ribosomal biogenesis factor-like [Camelus dromedarius]|nr:ribosomal biogenesis factor-like [Camelus bactrianus]XP_010994607.1 ribosomal biogenesis factor-like [Camelus dromedarius]XP_014420688.1 ribosomal biogenesis factor-like [Camelus ferus]
MAKNKLRGQRSRNVFHITSQKTLRLKIKPNQFTTNLLKINTSYVYDVCDEKVNRANKAFADTQKAFAHFSKGPSLEPLQKQLTPQQCHKNEPANVDEATRLTAPL